MSQSSGKLLGPLSVWAICQTVPSRRCLVGRSLTQTTVLPEKTWKNQRSDLKLEFEVFLYFLKSNLKLWLSFEQNDFYVAGMILKWFAIRILEYPMPAIRMRGDERLDNQNLTSNIWISFHLNFKTWNLKVQTEHYPLENG